MTRVTRALRLLREPRGLTRAFAQAHGPVHYGRGKRTGRSIKSAHTAALPAPPPRTTSLGETRALPDSSRLETFHSIVQLFARTIPPRRSMVSFERIEDAFDAIVSSKTETIFRSLDDFQRRRVTVIGSEHRLPTSFTGRGGSAIPLGTSLVTKLNRRGSRRRDN